MQFYDTRARLLSESYDNPQRVAIKIAGGWSSPCPPGSYASLKYPQIAQCDNLKFSQGSMSPPDPHRRLWAYAHGIVLPQSQPPCPKISSYATDLNVT